MYAGIQIIPLAFLDKFLDDAFLHLLNSSFTTEFILLKLDIKVIISI